MMLLLTINHRICFLYLRRHCRQLRAISTIGRNFDRRRLFAVGLELFCFRRRINHDEPSSFLTFTTKESINEQLTLCDVRKWMVRTTTSIVCDHDWVTVRR